MNDSALREIFNSAPHSRGVLGQSRNRHGIARSRQPDFCRYSLPVTAAANPTLPP